MVWSSASFDCHDADVRSSLAAAAQALIARKSFSYVDLTCLTNGLALWMDFDDRAWCSPAAQQAVEQGTLAPREVQSI